jgi:hypothetical protein
MGKLDQLTIIVKDEDEFKEYDEGYNDGKLYAEDTVKEVHRRIDSRPENYKDGFWDAIADHLYFV